MTYQTLLDIATRPRSFTDITTAVAHAVEASHIAVGIAHVFVRHTSCGLTISENADPDVQRDLETLARRWAPNGDPAYRHNLEGDDDMAAHGRSVLTGVSLTVPIANNRLLLGTWQGIYLWEHRQQSHQRQVVVTVLGQ